MAQLKLDGKRMAMESGWDHRLYVKDNQVWGEVSLRYGTPTADEINELNKGGFTAQGSGKYISYQKHVAVEGILYPAIKIPDGQLDKLGVRRTINLYHSKDEKPPVLPKLLKAPLIPLGIAVDTAVSPIFGVVGVIVAIAVASH